MLRGGARQPISANVGFIDENKEEFGVVSIVQAIRSTPARIAVRSYCAYKNRQPCERAIRDDQLCEVIQDVYESI